MISSTVSFLLASLILNSVSTSFAAPVRFTPRSNVDVLVPRAHIPNIVDNKLSRRIVQKDTGINEQHNSRRGVPITIVSSVTTVVQDGVKPGTIDLISTTTTVVEKGKGKSSCSGHHAAKKTCGKKKPSGARPGKNCGKKNSPGIPFSETNSTTILPGPSDASNTTVTPDAPPGSSNSTATPPTIQSPPILPEGPSDGPSSNTTVLIQDPNNNSSTTTPDDAPQPQQMRRRSDSAIKSASDSPKARGVKQRLDKRNRMSFS